MKEFDGDMLDIILEPQLVQGKKEYVQVTHDESHFYTNDRCWRIWTKEDEKTRKSCSYNYNNLLERISNVLTSVFLTKMCKFACKSWQYMDAYNKGLEGKVAEWAVKKYKSQCCLPENIEELIEQEKQNNEK
ncbi:5152_t:CDS:2 [Gigaspora margarita]|uniref:5152_t:CDS:1 n=1 Tax=Gigaspora margarita TaxID=4874 RepID=A0ABN7WTR8_GIGMA|nr:5152_t:CDS:2 [Gigaspora margarita]